MPLPVVPRERQVPIQGTYSAAVNLNVTAPGVNWASLDIDAKIYGPHASVVGSFALAPDGSTLHVTLSPAATTALGVGTWLWALRVGSVFWIGGRFTLHYPGADLEPEDGLDSVTISFAPYTIVVETGGPQGPAGPAAPAAQPITREELNAAGNAGTLTLGQMYLVTNEDPKQLVIATSDSVYINIDTDTTYIPSVALSRLHTIQSENALYGYEQANWMVDGAGNPQVLGYNATMSQRAGGSMPFKVHCATGYTIEIVRLGWYNGMGGRLVTTLNHPTPSLQPAPLLRTTGEGGIGCRDASNWKVTDVWSIDVEATHGVYIGVIKPVGGGGPTTWSHVGPFIVENTRSDAAKIIVMTSDSTWQAYNHFGTTTDPTSGKNLYGSSGNFAQGARSWDVSYDRPLMTTLINEGVSSYWCGERPIHSWLERNGYDVAYVSAFDVDSDGDIETSRLRGRTVMMACGHCEYWSQRMRDAWDAAIAAGVQQCLFTGNTMLWRTRFVGRIQECYKESHTLDGAGTGKHPSTWTGTWRDLRWQARRPENTTIGSLFVSNGIRADTVIVTDAYKNEPIWRNTPVASLGSGSSLPLKAEALGFEWDSYEPTYVASKGYPAELKRLSATPIDLTSNAANESGSKYLETITPAIHSIVAWRRAGKLHVNFGMTQWGWGLSDFHIRGSEGTNKTMQQAVVNVLADMGCQPATLQFDLTATTNQLASWTWPTLSSLTVTPATLAMVVGQKKQLPAEAVWSNGINSELSESAVWTSSNPAVATVNKGLVTCLTVGTTTITASFGATSDTCDITVSAAPPVLIDTWLPSDYVFAGTSNSDGPLKLGTSFRSASPNPLTVAGVRFWRTPVANGSAPVAYFGKAGAATPLASKAGSATTPLTAGWETITFDTPQYITDQEMHAVWVTPLVGYAALRPYFNSTLISRLGLFDSGPQPGAGKFSQPPGDPTQPPASVYQNSFYLIEPLILGNTGPVDPGAVSGISTTPATASVSIGQTLALTATATWTTGPPTNVTTSAVWTSSNTAVATVNSSGVVTGVSAGSATITASYSGFTDTTVVTAAAGPTIENFQLAANGTNTHTVNFSAASAGDTIMIIAAGGVTHTVSGGPTWTKRITAVSNTELSLHTCTATAGLSSATITHNNPDFPVAVTVIRFPGGTWNYIGGVQASATAQGDAFPTLSGITGSNVWVFAAADQPRDNGTNHTVGTGSWNSPNVEGGDLGVLAGTGAFDPKGYWYGWAYQQAYAGATYQPTLSRADFTGLSAMERIVFAISWTP